MTAGPLAGVRVVEIAGIGPGPFAAMMLADMGAEVLRVDRASTVAEPPLSAADMLNRGRRSVAVDLKHPDGAGVVLALAERAEILIEGFRPGVAERLGIGPEVCRAWNPALVYGRITGWGQDGPYASKPGHDINYISLTGALAAIGGAGGPRSCRSTWSATSAAVGCCSRSASSRRCSRRGAPASARSSTPR